MNDWRSLARRWAWPVIAVVIGLAVRIVWAQADRVVWGDEPFYLWLGQSWLTGHGYQFFGYSGTHFSPLFPLIAGGLGLLLGDLERGSLVVYVITGALLALPLYGIARRVHGEQAAALAALIAAVYPALTAGVLFWGTMTEPLFLLCAAVGIYGLVRATQEGGLGAWAMAAIAFGLAYLTRTEGLLYFLVGLAAWVILTWGRPVSLQRWLAGVGLYVVLFAVIILPYVIYLHQATGVWQLAEEAGAAFDTTTGLAYQDPAAFDKATWRLDRSGKEVYLFSPESDRVSFLDSVRANPRGFLRRVRRNLRDLRDTLFTPKLVPWAMVGLVALGLFSRPWDRRRLRGELLLIGALAPPLSFVLFFIQERYLAGMLLPIMLWAAMGTLALGDWLRDSIAQLCERWGRWREWRWLPAVLVLLILWLMAPQVAALQQRTHSFQRTHKTAGYWLRDHGVTAEDVVMCRYPAIAFHAGAAWAATPAEEWPWVLRYARARGADYLVVDQWEVERLRPQLRFLLDPAQAPPELEHLATLRGGVGPVVIYRLRVAQ
ncbi:MAG TPA: glycosyltransferase family 39 protein [Caldilineae bacterium]|nr:glycosyltransferase family 39 protein [Caldilineae bacterium]